MNDKLPLSVLSLLIVLGVANTTLESHAIENSDTDTIHRMKIATTVSIPMPAVSVQAKPDGQTASVLVDNTEVLTIRSSAGGLTASQRAEQIQARLERFLKYDGNPRDIKPGLEGNAVVVRAGKALLITLDEETAKKENKPIRQQAFEWTNNLRNALGAEKLDRDPMMVASRGFAPALPFYRHSGQVVSIAKGMASWYGPGFHGRRTANGERFNMNNLTAAHRSLPFNTLIRVTNNRNGQSIVVRVNDRGPYAHGRIIDLSKGAAQAIGVVSSGVAPVTLEVLD